MALTLAAVETAIESLVTGGVQSVMLDGTQRTMLDLTKLLMLRDKLKRESGSRFGYAVRPLKPPEH